MRKDLMKLTAVELGKKIKDKEVTVVEATKACLERIKALDETYNCFVTVDEAGALAQAEAIQAKIDSGELTGPLAGVPVAIKDNMCINGMLTSCSSKILSNFVPTYTATAVEKLQEAGAVIIGKTNMDEFAMGSTTETSYYGVTRNPWDTDKVPGGSSGGSAAAVAADAVHPEEKTLMITHCNCLERAEAVKNMVLQKISCRDVVIMDTRGVSSMYANDGGVIVTL